MAKKPNSLDLNKLLNSKPSIYLSGVVLGFLVASWYREQTGPVKWFPIVTGVIVSILIVWGLKNEKDDK